MGVMHAPCGSESRMFLTNLAASSNVMPLFPSKICAEMISSVMVLGIPVSSLKHLIDSELVE